MDILVIEDSSAVLDLIREGLTSAGHSSTEARTGEEGLVLVRERTFDAIILDIGLPGMNGFAVAARLRESGIATPVIMLTAMDAEEDIVRGLDVGADGYMTKPFSVPELLARLRALERRESLARKNLLSVGEVELDQITRQVTYYGKAVRLTEVEFKLLAALIRKGGEIVTREELLKTVWGMDFDPKTTVFDAHLSNLRKKLSSAGPPLIENLRGVGYRISSAED